MGGNRYEQKFRSLLELADVAIGGDRPWDVQIHDERLFKRALEEGSLGVGEAYMDGWWDCPRLDELACRVLQVKLNSRLRSLGDHFSFFKALLFNLQRPSRAAQIAHRHYNLGNDLYRLMLDKRMLYSCGYWRGASSLDEAQEAKIDLLCKKLGLEPGMRVLDIGCGWGGTARYAAEKYGVQVLGITVSEAQAEFAREHCRDLPVEIRIQDYREIKGRFDRIYSLGMFEHVGYKNYPVYCKAVRELLAPDGLFLLHTIGGNVSTVHGDTWVERYIFPNSMLPSAAQIASSAEGRFVIEDWHNFGADYDPTLMSWYRNFCENWPLIKEKYDERFYRMWTYYLLMFAGAFRARVYQLWQIVFSPGGVPGGYLSIR